MERLTGQENAGAAMTQAEAEEVVALWGKRMSELDEKASMPTTKDLAEALGVPPSQVALLLDEVRRKKAPPLEAPVTPPRKGLKPRHLAAMGIAGVFLAVFLFGASMLFYEARRDRLQASFEAQMPPGAVRVEMPEVVVPPFEISGLENLAKLRGLGVEFGVPLKWGPHNSLSAIIDGKATSLELKGAEDFFSSRLLAEEITRILQASTTYSPLKDSGRYLEKVSEIERSLNLGTAVGWEGIYRFKEVKLEVGGQSEGIKVPQLLMAMPQEQGEAFGAYEALKEAVLSEQILRITKGIQNLNKKVVPKAPEPGPAQSTDSPF